MAVLETIRNFFIPGFSSGPEVIIPAPPCEYAVRPLTLDHLQEALRLNIRCFRNGDNYTKYTFEYLLNEPRTLSYRMVTPANEMVGFAFVMVNENNAAHLTTIGVAPEHRRRKIAEGLLLHVEQSLRQREIGTIMLEVRVSNTTAQDLYRRSGYTIVQRIGKYYNNGEDCFLMMKALY
ncbi:MAG: ribosomal protein S18-alanine N-acetyltransferase [Chloracidobacterium sp.]|nr:ribosomal protein S18-alanine N-acetyltransferase [Chloracidobacterium sp.]